MNTDALQNKFEDLLTRIEDAKREVDAGTLGDMNALNKDITDVCTAIQNGPPATAKALQKDMGRIILKLDELAASITAYKDKLQEKK
jgi:uncharacterized protein YdcH (DUF465 family)